MLKKTQRRGSVKFNKNVEESWNSFRRGLNLLLQDFELNEEEYREGTNLVIKGKGILEQRPGSAEYFLAGSGKVRLLKPYYPKASGASQSLLAFTDRGFLTKKNGASYSIIPGASFPSGLDFSGAQIYNSFFFTAKEKPLHKFDGSTIYPYTGLSRPTNVRATKSSGTSGVFTFSYRISAESDTGETLASIAATVTNVPEFLTTTNFVTVLWDAVSGARGYAVYGQESGQETFMTRVPSSQTSWIDDGNTIPSFYIFPPEDDFTSGPKAAYLEPFGEKLVVTNLDGNPSRLMWSGGGPNVDKFHWSVGGGYVDINKDDGQELAGHIEFENRIVAFKSRSIWQVVLTFNDTLGVVEPVKRKINGAIGCIAPKTICQVENDVFYVGRRAGGGVSINTIGYQENIAADTLRTSELSSRIRPLMDEVNQSRLKEMWAIYWRNIYWLFYPVGATEMKCVGYDRERLAFVGPFDFPNSPANGAIYYESDSSERFVYGDGDDGFITEISTGYANDKGTDFEWSFQTKRGVGTDPFTLKNLVSTLIHLKSVNGEVNVQIYVEKTNGITSTAKAFSVARNTVVAGWGSFRWGYSVGWGQSEQASMTTSNLDDVIKWVNLNKASIRSYYIRITGSGLANIVAIKNIITQLPSTYLPANWRA